MRSLKSLCALICLWCFVSASAQTVTVHDRTFIANAFRISISADKLLFKTSDPVVIKFTITNTSKEALYEPAEPLVWSVCREDGKIPSDTPEGKQRKDSHRDPQTIVVERILSAGEIIASEETISKLYAINEPGAYDVTVEEAVGDLKGTAYIKSNTIRIIIR
jgi:hypothetical protein